MATQLRWQHSGKNTDGSNVQSSRNPHFKLYVNGVEHVNVPVAWHDGENSYTVPFADLGLPAGESLLQLSLAVQSPNVESALSAGVTVVAGVPTAPFGLSYGDF